MYSPGVTRERKLKYETMTSAELRAFVEKVRKLQAEGITTTDIAARFGIHRNTVNQRLRTFRGMS